MPPTVRQDGPGRPVAGRFAEMSGMLGPSVKPHPLEGGAERDQRGVSSRLGSAAHVNPVAGRVAEVWSDLPAVTRETNES